MSSPSNPNPTVGVASKKAKSNGAARGKSRKGSAVSVGVGVAGRPGKKIKIGSEAPSVQTPKVGSKIPKPTTSIKVGSSITAATPVTTLVANEVEDEIIEAKNENNKIGESESTDQKDALDNPSRLPWELDPSWNIAPCTTEGPSMNNFCTKYKPSEDSLPRTSTKNGDENDTSTDIDTAATVTPPLSQEEEEEEEESVSVEQEEQKSKHVGPEVEIIDGEIVLKESSVYIAKQKTMEEIDKEMGRVVTEDSQTLTATYTSYRNKPISKNAAWNATDIATFYMALRQCGTDFELMSRGWFRNRKTRHQLKTKYRKELKMNETLVDLALSGGRNKLDLKLFGLTEEMVNEVKVERTKQAQIDSVKMAQNILRREAEECPELLRLEREREEKAEKDKWEVIFEDDDQEEEEHQKKQQEQHQPHPPKPTEEPAEQLTQTQQYSQPISLSLIPTGSAISKKKKRKMFKAKGGGMKSAQKKKSVAVTADV